MKCYNLYHNGVKINKHPLKEDAMQAIFNNGTVSVPVDNFAFKQYKLSNIRVLECTLV